jgi:hypothetical protein
LARDIVVAGTEGGKQVALECINPKDLPTPEVYTQEDLLNIDLSVGAVTLWHMP